LSILSNYETNPCRDVLIVGRYQPGERFKTLAGREIRAIDSIVQAEERKRIEAHRAAQEVSRFVNIMKQQHLTVCIMTGCETGGHAPGGTVRARMHGI
jgi:hypothetical protein